MGKMLNLESTDLGLITLLAVESFVIPKQYTNSQFLHLVRIICILYNFRKIL